MLGSADESTGDYLPPPLSAENPVVATVEWLAGVQ